MLPFHIDLVRHPIILIIMEFAAMRIKKLVFVLLMLVVFPFTALTKEDSKQEYKVYIAGPDVFLPNPAGKYDSKRATIARFNAEVLGDTDFKFVAITPIDTEIDDFKNDPATAMKIFIANINHMQNADFVIANMSRFRGPSMDVGTAFEMGYMYALNKPVFGYYDMTTTYCTADQIEKTAFDCSSADSNAQTSYTEKVSRFANGYFINPTNPEQARDKYTHLIEEFGLADNLMMVGAVRYQSGKESGYAMADSFLAALHEAADTFRKLHSKRNKS